MPLKKETAKIARNQVNKDSYNSFRLSAVEPRRLYIAPFGTLGCDTMWGHFFF